VPRSRMLGTISPLSQYAFMAWCSVEKSTGTTSPFYLCVYMYIRTPSDFITSLGTLSKFVPPLLNGRN
jgi:hypothetical protein